MTPTQFLLLDLIISNIIRAAFERVSKMSPEEVQEEIKKEQDRRAELLSRL